MNKVLKSLCERRSCRKYQGKQVSQEELKMVLEAGLYAPSGMNRQSVIFLAIQDKESIAFLSALNAQILEMDCDPFYGAPTLIVVLADRNVGTWVEDGSLAMGNLMNAAHALGLGSCWIHRARQTFDDPIGRAFLNKCGIPENYSGVGNCILGYSAEEAPTPPAPRRENRIFLL